MIDVSFIVPVYNVEQYLEKCIDSLLHQTHQSFEIILIDDGSPDGCGAICDTFAKKDNRVRVVHKSNEGLSAARNDGIKMATGYWLCFIDSDDFLDCDHIERLLSCSSNKSYDIIIGNYFLHDQTINRSYIPLCDVVSGEYESSEIIDTILKNLISSGSCMSVWRNLYNTEFIKNNSLFFMSERLVYAEDYIFNIEAYSISMSINVVNTASYHHILQKKSLSQSYRKCYYQMALKRYEESVKLIRQYHGNKFDQIINRVSIIPYSLYKESLCDFKEAVTNVKRIISSNFAVSVFQESPRVVGKFAILYFLAKNKAPITTVLVAKFISYMEKPYRYYKYLRSCY